MKRRNPLISSGVCAARLTALFVILLAALVRAGAQTAVYRAVPNWPRGGGKSAPGYGTAMAVGIATDARGQVYVFQRTPHPVLVFDRDGRFLRAWGAGRFLLPHGCRFDPQGHLWLTDVGRQQVMEFTPEGRLLRAFGVRNRPGDDARHFNRPADVAFASGGDFYVADGYGNARVVRFSRAGQFRQAWGRRGTGPGQFHLVHALVVDAAGRVYVADRENHRIQVFGPNGKFLAQWRQVGVPFGLFLTRDQRVFVADGLANTISIYDLQGRRLARWGGTGRASGLMRRAHSLCVDDRGAVYVAEVNGRRVQKFILAPVAPSR